MNHASYFQIFEEARWDWIGKGGYGYERVQSEQKGPVILDLSIRFKKELRFRDRVIIETRLVEQRSKISQVSQVMKNDAGELLTEMQIVFGFMDLRARKLILPPQDWVAAIS